MDKYQKYVGQLSNEMLVNDIIGNFAHPKNEEEEKYLLAFVEEIKRRLPPTNPQKICVGCKHNTEYGCDNQIPDLRLRVVCDGFEEWDDVEEPDCDEPEDPFKVVSEIDFLASLEKFEAIMENPENNTTQVRFRIKECGDNQ